MPISRAEIGLAALVAALIGTGVCAGLPALGQDKPTSILPPGFDQPPAARPPVPAPPRRPVESPTRAPATPVAPRDGMIASSPTPDGQLPVDAPTPPPGPTPSASPTPGASVPARYELPAASRRSLAVVGIFPHSETMLEPDAFGTADGRYIEQLMRRTAAPVASRWLSIALRRMLVQPLATPANVNGADFAAERAWLLVRMGESIGARAVVQSVDPDNYTPKLYQIALQAALASGDPAGLCPLVPGAMAASNERGWTLIKAICVGLSGESAASAQLIKRAGNSGFAGGVDLLLAQKLAGQGAGGRQAATIEWASVDHLSIWRFGLATASGETIPDTLFDDMGRQVRYWQVLSPMVDPAGRAGQAEVAAAQGVLSNLALVDLYGAVDADADQSSAPGAVARDLRAAYTGPTVGARMEALRQLWEEPKVPAERYGRLILTARAAARIPADPSVTDVNRLVAAMVSVGMDRTATRWTGKAARGSIGWALLALADPDDARPWAASDIGALDDPGGRKARMFLAGLAGLGKLDGAEAAARSYGVDLAGVNSWTRAIDAAARERRPGEVLVLAAVGMQTPDWSGVPPEALFHIVRALRVVGLGGMARMIAAEAVTRA